MFFSCDPGSIINLEQSGSVSLCSLCGATDLFYYHLLVLSHTNFETMDSIIFVVKWWSNLDKKKLSRYLIFFYRISISNVFNVHAVYAIFKYLFVIAGSIWSLSPVKFWIHPLILTPLLPRSEPDTSLSRRTQGAVHLFTIHNIRLNRNVLQ